MGIFLNKHKYKKKNLLKIIPILIIISYLITIKFILKNRQKLFRKPFVPIQIKIQSCVKYRFELGK